MTTSADPVRPRRSLLFVPALRPDRLVMPKAVTRACLSEGGSLKKAVSVGLAPGHPPST